MTIEPGSFRHTGSVLEPYASLCRRLRLLAMLGPVAAFGAGFAVLATAGYFGVNLDWKFKLYVALVALTLHEFLILRRASSANIVRQVRAFVIAGVVSTCLLLFMFVLATYSASGAP